VGQGLVQLGEGGIGGGGDVVLGHQLLGEGLAGLNDGGVGPGAEGGNARLLQSVHHAHGQGVVWGHHDEIHVVFLGPSYHAGHVGGLDIHAGGHLGDAAVAGGAEQLSDLGGLGQLPADGVLPAAAAHYEYSHGLTLLLVVEQAHAGEGHDDSILVAGFDD